MTNYVSEIFKYGSNTTLSMSVSSITSVIKHITVKSRLDKILQFIKGLLSKHCITFP